MLSIKSILVSLCILLTRFKSFKRFYVWKKSCQNVLTYLVNKKAKSLQMTKQIHYQRHDQTFTWCFNCSVVQENLWRTKNTMQYNFGKSWKKGLSKISKTGPLLATNLKSGELSLRNIMIWQKDPACDSHHLTSHTVKTHFKITSGTSTIRSQISI